MIGFVRTVWAGQPIKLILGDDLRWSCDHPDPAHARQIAGWLQVLFDPRQDLAPSRGQPGRKALEQVFEWLDSQVEGLSEPEGERDVVY